MKPDKPLTLEQTLEALHQASEDSKVVDEVLAMSREQVDAEFAQAGIDVNALDSRLAAREAEIRRTLDIVPAVAARMTLAHTFSRKLAALFLAIGTLLGGLGTYAVELITAATRVPIPLPVPTFSAPPPAAAEALRTKGFEACGRGHWQECLDDFDRAKAQDSDGDAQPEVKDARARATSALHR